MSKSIHHSSKKEAGQGLVEYTLILVLVAVVSIVMLISLGDGVSGVFCSVTSILDATIVCDEPEEGDQCVDFYEPTWHYVWEYQGEDWVRIANPNVPLPLCSWSDPDNGTYPAGVGG